ncbi:hypothetical protein D910_02090 [Dendroctonus ponderosae]|uniref:Uncharacterized protein n=1 Tax=Dendroctonus ponderosae TaxID=77166 RepID=U4TXD8_DENPD|nr:hypothetical protein D910_02090 [Dendroctonus ponderosae]
MIKNWLEERKLDSTKKMMHDLDTQTEKGKAKEIGTQTGDIDLVSQLEPQCDYHTWKERANKKWDIGLYTNTEVKEGNPIETKDNTTKVLLIFSDKTKSQSQTLIEKLYIEKYPDLKDIQDDFGVLEQQSTIKMKSPGKTIRKKL